jgi:hypothetical protein
MNIIICNKNTFKYFEDYISSILSVIKGQLFLFDYEVNISIDKNNNYIFVQNIDNKFFECITKYNNIYLINTEQLSVEKSQIEINKYPNSLNVIDYIESNLKFYKQYNLKYLLPYQINNEEIYNINKEKQICLIGTVDNIPFNRQNIINILKEKNINIDIVSGFNKIRDAELFKYKIILNIGYYPNNCRVMETFRCDRCIYNKMIVISDMKDDIENYYLKDYVIFTEYNNIPDKVIEVINNYDEYYNKLFSNFDLKEIQEKLDNLSKNVINKLNE